MGNLNSLKSLLLLEYICSVNFKKGGKIVLGSIYSKYDFFCVVGFYFVFLFEFIFFR